MTTQLEQTQAELLSHHGGDGQLAAQRTHDTYQRNHDEAFWAFWQQWAAPVLPDDGSLIDLGAGVGLFAQTMATRFPQMNVSAIECAPYMLAQMVSLPDNTRLIVDDLNAPQNHFPAGSVDLCVANMLIHEMHQPILLFKRVREWLKPGGRLILIDMVRQPLQSYLDHSLPAGEPEGRALLEDVFQHFLEHNRYTPDDLVYLLERCGLRVETVEPFKRGRAVRIVATVNAIK